MDPFTIGALAVVGLIALVLFVMVRIADWQTMHPKPATYECSPDECDHEWEHWDEEYETTISYSSYGGNDSVGTVIQHHSFCPKCGTHEVTEDAPIPNE